MAVDYSKEIEAIEQRLNGGVQSISTDGLSVQFNLEQDRKRLAELLRLQNSTLSRPRVVQIDLGNAW